MASHKAFSQARGLFVRLMLAILMAAPLLAVLAMPVEAASVPRKFAGIVVDAAFDGRGCAISQATASMLMEEVVGKPLDEVKQWDKEYVLDLLGIEIGPVRLKCALLPLKVLKAGAWGLEEWPE